VITRRDALQESAWVFLIKLVAIQLAPPIAFTCIAAERREDFCTQAFAEDSGVALPGDDLLVLDCLHPLPGAVGARAVIHVDAVGPARGFAETLIYDVDFIFAEADRVNLHRWSVVHSAAMCRAAPAEAAPAAAQKIDGDEEPMQQELQLKERAGEIQQIARDER
jgi:hypothetical protein